MALRPRITKTSPSLDKPSEPPPDITSGGEPGQTDEERQEWKDVLRKDAQEKTSKGGPLTQKSNRD
jgi:hypothetical protein